MNNRTPRLATLALMLAALTACTKTNITPNDDLTNALNPSSGAPIAFESQDAFTKADDNTDPEAFMAVRAGGFKVWSWFQGTTSGPMFGENGTVVTDNNYVADLEEGQTMPDPNWTYSPTRYWLNGTYDFAAVYPATIPVEVNGEITQQPISGTYAPAEGGTTPVLTVTDFDVTNQDDLLVAFNTGIDGGNHPSKVDLSFQHALSNLQLQLMLDRDDFFIDEDLDTSNGKEKQVGKAYVSIVGFNNIVTTASLAASKSDNVAIQWNAKDTNGQLRLNYSQNPKQVTAEYTDFFGDDGLLIIPQQLSSGNGELYMQVVIYPLGNASESITKEFRVTLPSDGPTTWTPNTKYIYRGVITQELVIEFSVVKVVDWEEDTLGGFIVR